jgi:hypothetical protein
MKLPRDDSIAFKPRTLARPTEYLQVPPPFPRERVGLRFGLHSHQSLNSEDLQCTASRKQHTFRAYNRSIRR